MAPRQLEGMRVAILVTDDFEQSELTTPKQALEEAGAQALIVSPASLVGLSGSRTAKAA
jgi:protease I